MTLNELVIRKEVPRLPVIVRTVSGATLLGLTHSSKYANNWCILCIYLALNEMFNGLVARRYGKEQFWISNSLAGFSTFSLYYIFESKQYLWRLDHRFLIDIVRGKPFGESFTKSKKYVGFLTLGFMLQEVVMIKLRDHYLQRQPVKLEWGFDVYELKVDPLLPPEIGTTRVRHHHSLQQRRQTEVSDV